VKLGWLKPLDIANKKRPKMPKETVAWFGIKIERR